MHSGITILLCALLAAPLANPQKPELGSDPPKLIGETADGNPIELPQASTGKIAVLIFGFSKQGGQQTRAWEGPLSRDFAAEASVTTYTIAMLESAPGLLRGMIKSGIRSGTPVAKRGHMVISTTGEPAWKKFLAVSDTNVPYLLILDPSGHTRWSGRGSFEPGLYESLKAAIKDVKSPAETMSRSN